MQNLAEIIWKTSTTFILSTDGVLYVDLMFYLVRISLPLSKWNKEYFPKYKRKNLVLFG